MNEEGAWLCYFHKNKNWKSIHEQIDEVALDLAPS